MPASRRASRLPHGVLDRVAAPSPPGGGDVVGAAKGKRAFLRDERSSLRTAGREHGESTGGVAARLVGRDLVV